MEEWNFFIENATVPFQREPFIESATRLILRDPFYFIESATRHLLVL
jgi:hypothetical protein